MNNVTPELSSRDGIIELPYYAGHHYAFTENHTLTEQGDRYDVSIQGMIPRQLTSEDVMQTLRKGEWIVLHEDARGVIRISGTQLIPLRYSSQQDTGDSPEVLNGETFKFSAIESEPSPECYIADFLNL